MVPPASSYDKQLHSNHTSHSPKVDLGAAPTTNGGTSLKRPVGGTTPTLDTPRTPTSKVKEQSIKIPDFFKNNKVSLGQVSTRDLSFFPFHTIVVEIKSVSLSVSDKFSK